VPWRLAYPYDTITDLREALRGEQFDLIGFAMLLIMCSGGLLHSPHWHGFFEP
jgi:hypothetical protein